MNWVSVFVVVEAEFMGLGLQLGCSGNGSLLLFQFKAYVLAEFSHLLERVIFELIKLPIDGVRPTHIRENHMLYYLIY